MKKVFIFFILALSIMPCYSQAYWIYEEAQEFFYGSGGRTQSYDKAFFLYQKAADMGSPDAMFKLSICYADGYGTEKSGKQEFYWLRKAAKLGHTGAQRELGACYMEGDYCRQSYRKFYYWSLQAANKGDEIAIQNLQVVGAYPKIIIQFDDE